MTDAALGGELAQLTAEYEKKSQEAGLNAQASAGKG